MKEGYVYVLINQSFIDLIKIGQSAFDPTLRARQLSAASGVPTPFKVAFEIYSNNCDQLEALIHAKLDQYRTNKNREFFRYPSNKAIRMLIELNKIEDSSERYEAIEVLPLLKEKYKNYIKAEISSIRILHTLDKVYFEFTEDQHIADYLKNQIIKRIDTAFIVENVDDLTFLPQNNIYKSMAQLLDFDDISMGMCFGEIFTDIFYKETK